MNLRKQSAAPSRSKQPIMIRRTPEEVLKGFDISFLKELQKKKTNTPIVNDVLYATLIIFDQEPNLINAAKMLKDPNLISKLINIDQSTIIPKLNKLKKYIIKKSFRPVEVSNHSVAACFLCEWVIELYNQGVHDRDTKNRSVLAEKRSGSMPNLQIENKDKTANIEPIKLSKQYLNSKKTSITDKPKSAI